MKIAHVVFARDKAPWVGQTVHSVLRQNATPIEFVFSDQGSKDGTLAIIRQMCATYNGPNKITILECPVTEPRGRHGLIEHINWLHDRLDHDYWVTCAADDIDMPDRITKTFKTIRELERTPLFFATAQNFLNADGSLHGVTAHPQESKWITPIENISHMVGGSSSGAWAPALLQRYGKLPETCLVDVYMPFCAALEDSFYYLHDYLHCYIRREDPDNTGLEGLIQVAEKKGEGDEVLRLRELGQFELAANTVLMAKVAQARYDMEKEGPRKEALAETLAYCYNAMLCQCGGWCEARQKLVQGHIRPGVMKW